MPQGISGWLNGSGTMSSSDDTKSKETCSQHSKDTANIIIMPAMFSFKSLAKTSKQTNKKKQNTILRDLSSD